MFLWIILAHTLHGVNAFVKSTSYRGNCIDNGCSSQWGNHGSCVDFSNTDVDFEHLGATFNLSSGAKPGLCGHNSNGKKDCCHCLNTFTSTELTPTTTTTTTSTTTTPPSLTGLGTLVIIGGDTENGATASIETILGDPPVPRLPEERWGHNAFILPNSEMVVCGGKGQHHNMALSRGCISLPSLTSSWTKHSDLNQPRISASAVTMTSGDIFLLGGWYSDMTSEVLLKGASTWSQGPGLPDSLDSACALSLDDNNLVTIGGGRRQSTVSKYNTATETWDHTWPQLPEGRRGHSCARLGSILLVAGGFSYQTFEYTDSALTINVATGISSSVASMNFPRAYFSLLTMGDAFVAIGGVTSDGYTAEVEAFFNYTQTWSPQYSDLSR